MLDLIQKQIITKLRFENLYGDTFNKSFKIIADRYFNSDISKCLDILDETKLININTFNEKNYYKYCVEMLLNTAIYNKLNAKNVYQIITVDIKEEEFFTPYDTEYNIYIIGLFINKREFVNNYVASLNNVPNGVEFFYRGNNTVYYRITNKLAIDEVNTVININTEIENVLNAIDSELKEINNLFKSA